MGEIIREREIADLRENSRRTATRAYGAANRNRGNADWTTTPTTSNWEARISIATLRARARQMCRDDSLFRKFLQMAETNVVGPEGIQLDVRATAGAGTTKRLNKDLNDKVKRAFWQWGHAEFCSVTGKQDFAAQQRLFVRTLVRDGEVLVVKQYDGPWGYRLKFVDVNYLDETYNEVRPNGNRIIMSVEVDANDCPVRYWLTTPSSDINFTNRRERTRVPIEAKDVIHSFFVIDDDSQIRGITTFAAALITGRDRGAFSKAVLTQAKVTAMAGGFLIPPADDMEPAYTEDDEGRETAPQMDWRPMSMPELPPGYDFKQFDPKQPVQNHPEYMKTLIGEVATGVGVNYFSLSGDLSAVNYSSARAGLAEEREMWRVLQTFVADKFCNIVYHDWLTEANLAGKLILSPREYAEVQMPYWQPRGWRYVDPQKEMNADILGVTNGLRSVSSVLADQGIDIRDHLEEIQQEKALFAEYEVDYPTAAPKQLPPPSDDKEPPDDGEDEPPKAGDDEEE